MTTVSLHEAQAHLTELLDAAERGEHVVIERDGRLWRLVPDPECREVRFGFLADLVTIVDPNWDAPMDGEELREMLGDEYVSD